MHWALSLSGKDGSAMTTGVWSKRIKEAQPNGPSNAMAWVGVVLVGVMGLGFQVKIRALRMFMAEAYEFFGNDYRQRVRQGVEAERRYAARHGRGFEYSRNYEEERANFDRQRAQFHEQQQLHYHFSLFGHDNVEHHFDTLLVHDMSLLFYYLNLWVFLLYY